MIFERQARVEGIERLQCIDGHDAVARSMRPGRHAAAKSSPPGGGPLKTQNITAVNDSQNRLQQHHLTFTVFQITMRRRPFRAPMVKAGERNAFAVVQGSNLAR
jgi:hypothetical protein